jgi:hypothetical protein
MPFASGYAVFRATGTSRAKDALALALNPRSTDHALGKESYLDLMRGDPCYFRRRRAWPFINATRVGSGANERMKDRIGALVGQGGIMGGAAISLTLDNDFGRARISRRTRYLSNNILGLGRNCGIVDREKQDVLARWCQMADAPDEGRQNGGHGNAANHVRLKVRNALGKCSTMETISATPCLG